MSTNTDRGRLVALHSALERITDSYRLLLARKPVRDVEETLAEADAALSLPQASEAPTWLSFPTTRAEAEAILNVARIHAQQVNKILGDTFPDLLSQPQASTPAAPPAVPAGIVWPTMPLSKSQSHVLFEDGYAEGWAKCLDACKAALSTAPAEQAPSTPAPDVDVPAMPEPVVYLNPAVYDAAKGKIRCGGALTHSDDRCGCWTMPLYTADQLRERDAQWAARLAAAAPQSVGDWCVGEYVSSADPRKRVKLLSEGAAEIAKDRAHRDFIRWLYVAPDHAAPTEPSDAEDAARYRHIRAHSYVEVHCDSPRHADWNPVTLDAAIDAARKGDTR